MEIKLNQLKHKDWEDITADSDHFYIADTGNNYATRENLRIYILDRHFFIKGRFRFVTRHKPLLLKNLETNLMRSNRCCWSGTGLVFKKQKNTPIRNLHLP